MKAFSKYLFLSQVSLMGLLIVCCLLLPSVVIDNGGVSNFGNHIRTVVFYILSFSLCTLFLGLAARVQAQLSGQRNGTTYLLLFLALLELLVLLSTFPRHISYTYSDIHDYIGIVLFGYELVISIWLTLKHISRQKIALIGAEVSGSLVALLSIVKVIHFLFVGQLVGGVAFGILLYYALPAITAASLKSETKQ
jgi:hypothetical protein